jgi:hypothetical protein
MLSKTILAFAGLMASVQGKFHSYRQPIEGPN